MKTGFFIFWKIALIIFLVIAGFKETRAEIRFTDCFSVGGFLRYELAVHTGVKNPANVFQADNNDFNYSRTMFQTEWTYKPSNKFKLYSKIRITGDQTYHIDDEISKYNAFPIDVPDYDWTMMKVSEDDYRLEVWELYADLSIGNLWLRLGKQQIAWGEMIATRLMDIINPLDFSRNLLFEPEEFENIRIPNWSIRGTYLVSNNFLNTIRDFTVEGFLNPGDVLPTQYAASGAPFNLVPPFPPFMRIHEKDNRGKMEYGFRLGGMMGDFYSTLNYLHLYTDDSVFVLRGFTPDPIFGVPFFAPFDFTPYAMLFDARYPSIDIYGATFNYYISAVNTVVTFEGTWVPNQPYGDAFNPMSIKDKGTWSYALAFARSTFVLPRPTSAMDITLQFNQTVREGDKDDILGIAGSSVDKSDEIVVLSLRQPLHHDDFTLSAIFVYDCQDAHMIKPGIHWVYGDHWYFDLYAVFLGGAETRPGRFGSLDWANEVFGRVTFQF